MKKTKRGWKIAGIISGALLLLIVAAILILPKVLFTDYEGLPTTGEYGVKQTAAILIDESRVETFEKDGSKREVPVYFFYPEVKAGEGDKKEFPLVLFSHGAFGYYQSNMSTYMELASRGYVVVSLDHPYHSFFTKDTDGKTITVNSQFMSEVMEINGENIGENEIIQMSRSWLDIRVADMGFALDSIKTANQKGQTAKETWFVTGEDAREEIEYVLGMTDVEKIGLMGHSLGGAASVTLGRTREDIDAVIDLDGTMIGEEFGYENGVYAFYRESYPVPLLAFSNEEHHFEREKFGSMYVNNVVLENAKDASYTYIEGSGHMNFTDLPLFSPPLASMLGVGDVDPKECVLSMNRTILKYYDYYLKNKGDRAEWCLNY